MLIDLSHRIEPGMITYKSLPAPVVCDFLSRETSRALYDGGAEFAIQRIDMVGNTGTYLDSRSTVMPRATTSPISRSTGWPTSMRRLCAPATEWRSVRTRSRA